MKSNYIICLDNGHGADTKGKCSPDQQIKEYFYAREIVQILSDKLKENGYNVFIVTPESNDVSLKERVNRVNKVYKDNNKKAILISVHLNAAGLDNKWHDANGWQVCVSPNASNNSKTLANCLYDSAETLGLKMRKPLPNQKYWEQNLYICKYTNCPAVLTENLFQDNKNDVGYLLTHKEEIANLHYNAIVKCLSLLK